MTSQLVALATQLRNPSTFAEAEAAELELAGHMFISASLQVALSRELVAAAEDPGRQVPHLAMMFSTARSHLELVGKQPVTDRTTENTNPRKASFMSVLPLSVITNGNRRRDDHLFACRTPDTRARIPEQSRARLGGGPSPRERDVRSLTGGGRGPAR